MTYQLTLICGTGIIFYFLLRGEWFTSTCLQYRWILRYVIDLSESSVSHIPVQVSIFEFKTLTRTMSVDTWIFAIAPRDKVCQWHFRSASESVLWWHVAVNPWANNPSKWYFQEQYFFSFSSPQTACSNGWLSYRLVRWTLMKLK